MEILKDNGKQYNFSVENNGRTVYKINQSGKKIVKVVISAALIGTLLFGANCAFGKSQLEKSLEDVDYLGDGIEQVIEEDNVCINESNHKDSQFRIINCSTYKDYEENKESISQDIEKYNTPFLIKIESKATNYAEIYKEVDFVKSLIMKYGTTYPIILDLSTLISNNENIGDVKVMVDAFCSKLSANGCLVTLKGTPSDFEKLDKFKGISKMISLDTSSEEILTDALMEELDNIYFIEDLSNNVVYSTANFTSLEYDYNNPDNFREDLVITIGNGDTLYELSERYNLSVNNLKEYNDLTSDILYVGQEVKIPNVEYRENVEIKQEDNHAIDSNSVVVNLDKYYVGIDVSEHQGPIDWLRVKESGVDFAIIRITDIGKVDANGNILLDDQYLNNIRGCQAAGIPFGTYYYSRATTMEEMNKEIQFVLNAVEGIDMQLPLYLDFESQEQENLLKNANSNKLMNDLINHFCYSVEAEGYATGVYIRYNLISYIPEVTDYAIWGNGGYLYNTAMDINNIDIGYTEASVLNNQVNTFQITSSGIGETFGVPGRLDVNISEKTFIDTLLKNNANHL